MHFFIEIQKILSVIEIMYTMELIQILFSVVGTFGFVYQHRSKIYNMMSKSKVGLCIMSPIIAPTIMATTRFRSSKDSC